jgi:hypothetical protein
MYIEEIKLNLDEILDQFICQEIDLLQVNSSEQAISNRLSRIIEDRVNGWNVDCEYNRDNYDVKRLKYSLIPDGEIED